MSSIIISLLLDGGLAVLLCVTILYCSRLSKRIRTMQDSRSELATMIAQFDESTQRATAAMGELQSVSKRITDALQLKIEKANFLADDLAFLIEKSAKAATQLEQAKKQVKPEMQAHEKFAQPHVPQPQPQAAPAKPAVKSYFDSVPPAPKPAEGSSASSIQDIPRASVAASLEAVLQRLASGGTRESNVSDIASVPRTNAERELMAALKANG